jgi:tetratricopeptide (TPR) repeat protein
VTADARVRLARWYARQRRYGDATVQLRLALGQGVLDARSRTVALVLLASVYMNTGRLAEAIDLLASANAGAPTYQSDAMPTFALAVAYDRDEQVTLAHDTIQRMLSQAPDALQYVLYDQSGTRNPLVPACERHYFAALQHEALGNLSEARTEWQAYAKVEDAPYRGRARQHVADIEGMMRERRRAPAPKVPRMVVPPPWQPPGWSP